MGQVVKPNEVKVACEGPTGHANQLTHYQVPVKALSKCLRRMGLLDTTTTTASGRTKKQVGFGKPFLNGLLCVGRYPTTRHNPFGVKMLN